MNRSTSERQCKKKPLRIAMIAGEASGDILASGLIKAIQLQHPNAIFYGIGGDLMEERGFNSLYPIELLSVMGLVEVLKHLPVLISMRNTLKNILLSHPPDIFIGIDAPDFNLNIEYVLKKAGIPVIHYVGPQVWAWRQWRLKKIRQSVDHLLVLLPFETEFYKKHHISATFVGHALAEKIPLITDVVTARRVLNIPLTAKVVALMPGSRYREISRLGALFFSTAVRLEKSFTNMIFLVPCNKKEREEQLTLLVKDYPTIDIRIISNRNKDVIAAADAVLVASGTATLEVALYKKPMVVSYRLHWLTYFIMKFLVKIKYVALPNILANRLLVPEFLQYEATVNNLYTAMKKALTDNGLRIQLEKDFMLLHKQLRQDGDMIAYQIVISLLKSCNKVD